MPPTGQYNVFELSTGSVVGISTTATIGLSTTSVISLTTTSVVGLTTTSVVGLTTTSVVGLTTTTTVAVSTGGTVYTQAVTPSTANVLAGVTNSTASALLAIPASRWWKGSLALTGALINNSTTANLAVTYQILTTGASIVPSSQGLLDVTIEVGPGNTGVASNNCSNASIDEVYVYGGSTGGSLALAAGTGTFIAASASATGLLL